MKRLVFAVLALLVAVSMLPSTTAAHAVGSLDYRLSFSTTLANDSGTPPTAFVGGGAPEYVEGVQGQAIHLTHDNYVRLEAADAAAIDYTGSFSVAYWIKFNSRAGGDPVVMGNKNWDSGGNPGWVFNATDKLRLNYRASEGARGDIDVAGLVSLTEWAHIAATFDVGSSTVKVYVNGEMAASKADASLAGNLNGAGPTLLGQAYANNGLYNSSGMNTDFLLDEFRLQEGVLSAGTVKTLYDESKPRGPFTVTGVSVSPRDIRMSKGSETRFVATVSGEGSPEQDVVWELAGAQAAGTQVATDGTLTVDATEAASVLTLRARSAYDADVYGEAQVTLQNARTDGTVTFGVLSDVHVGPSSTGNNSRFEKALTFLSDPALNAEVVVVDGDLTGNGTAAEMGAFKEIKDRALRLPLVATMGNHEENKWENFELATGNKANDVKVINGYYFILLSPGAGTLDEATGRASGENQGDYAYLRSWVTAKVAEAEAASPDKPVFVFFHHPIRGTHYVSDEQWGTGLEGVFNNHPRVVTFSGHIHSPNNTPRSIWQDGGFTTVNTAATCSGEMERGMIYGGITPAALTMSQGLYVEADSEGNVTIKTRDLTADEWIEDQAWSFNVNGELPYTTAAREALAQAPEFDEGAAIALTNLNMNSVDVEFDQAKLPAGTGGDIVYAYRYDLIETETGEVAKSFKNFSDFILRPMPTTLVQPLEGLKKATEYEMRIYALDAWGKVSTGYLSKRFTTTTIDTTPRRPIDYVLEFDNTLESGGNAAPEQVGMFFLESKPGVFDTEPHFAEGRHGQAISLSPLNFVDLDGTAELIDYGQSFSVAFWANIQAHYPNGQPALLSNRNADSDDLFGYAIRTDTGGGRHEVFLEYHPVSGAYARFKLCDFEIGKWVHLALTFDYEGNKVRAYADGKLVVEADADLSGGIGGVSGLGRNKSTFLGSSPWNYTEEHGGFNGSGTAARHTVSFLADDFLMSSCVYTSEEIDAISRDAANRPANHTVTFDADGGFPAPATRLVYDGRTIQEPSVPVKDGFAFEGWYAEGTAQPYEFSTPIAADMVLSARWSPLSAPNPYLTLEGPTAATAGDTLDYTVSLGAVKDAGTIRVDVTPTGTLEFLEATSLDAEGKLSVASTKKKADGTISVILTATELPGITFDGASPILKLSFKATAEGQGSVTLIKAEGASYIYNGSQFEGTADIEVALPEGADATITTAIAKYIDPYDFNRDDKVTLADLTYVQAFYMASEGTGGYRWEHAVERGMDLDASGTIDVADLILIIDHLYEIEA
jgi:uncharacterized repeat protein (TIGR02543 family)